MQDNSLCMLPTKPITVLLNIYETGNSVGDWELVETTFSS